VTRCRSRKADDAREYQRYVDESHMVDHGLLFHAAAGATIGQLVPNYRPADTINFGYGVLITYELRKSVETAEAASAGGAAVQTEAEAVKLVCDVLDSLSYMDGTAKREDWTHERKQQGFMQLGLDSLDVVQLVAKLNDKIAPVSLSQTIVFDKPNAAQLARFIFEECNPKRRPQEIARPTGADDLPSFGPEVSVLNLDAFGKFEFSLPRLPNGEVDYEAYNQPPQGDRSAEGLKWHPALGYHKDLGEESWAGKTLTYPKLVQIQAYCSAWDMDLDVRTMQHWTVTQVKDYFEGRGPP